MTKEEAMCYLHNPEDEDCYNAKEVEAYNLAIKALEHESKTGHWIDKSKQSDCGVNFIHIECSECGEPSGLNNTYAKYCPWCGVKMVKPQESEEK